MCTVQEQPEMNWNENGDERKFIFHVMENPDPSRCEWRVSDSGGHGTNGSCSSIGRNFSRSTAETESGTLDFCGDVARSSPTSACDRADVKLEVKYTPSYYIKTSIKYFFFINFDF